MEQGSRGYYLLREPTLPAFPRSLKYGEGRKSDRMNERDERLREMKEGKSE